MADSKKEEEFFCAKIRNLVSIAEQQNYAKYSHFLDERQQRLAKEILQQEHCHRYRFEGGCPGAERRMLAVYPEYMESEELDFPISILLFRYPKEYSLTHRDFLGSLMATQIKREMLGDILVSEDGQAVLFVEQSLAGYLIEHISKIGRIGVKIQQVDISPLEKTQKFEEVNGTVASLRVDSVLTLITRLSRSKSVDLLTAGRVALNYEEIFSPSSLVKPGDVLSVRGYGKYRLSEQIHLTKKNRYHIMIQKFI